MPASALTLAQRVATYASDVIHDPQNLKAMKVLVETHFGRSWDAQNTSVNISPHRRRGAVIETGIKDAVLAVVLASPGEVGRDVVLRKLEREGFPFSAKDRKKAVSDALQRLGRAGAIVKTGKGRSGNLYRKP
jgi:hypothetical protein